MKNFYIIFVQLLLLTKLKVILCDVNSAAYQGCYRENKRFRHFSFSPGNYDASALSPEICQNLCGKWRKDFSALTAGTGLSFCFCADTLSSEGLEDNTWCNSQCSGDPDDICGSFDHVSVYLAGKPTTGLEVRTLDEDRITPIFTEVEFEYSTEASSSLVKYAFKYEGANDEFTPLNETGQEVKQFSVPGEYDVIVQAIEESGVVDTVEAGVKLLVEAPVRGLELLCPSAIATYEEMSANATLDWGTHMTITIDWDDENAAEVFPIADAVFHHTSGARVPNVVHITSQTLDSFGETYYLWDREFEYDGRLVAIEGIASDTLGGITVMVAAPTCSDYCHTTRTCGSCSGEYGGGVCSSNEAFCGAQGQCVNGNVCSGDPNDRFNTTHFSYTVVHAFTITLTDPGYFKYVISEDDLYEVTAGSIMAYTPVTGKLYSYTISSGERSERTASNPVPIHHFLRGIYSRPSTVLFYHEYQNPETYNVVLNVTGEYLSDFRVQTCEIVAQEGINFTIIEHDDFSGTGWDTVFNITSQSGTNKTHFWDFGDGSNLTTANETVSHVYTRRGEYNISCVSENLISMKTNFTSIIIEDPIVNVTFTSGYATTNTDHQFIFTANSGSDFECSWDFDGNGAEDSVTDDITSPIDGSGIITYEFTTPSATYNASVICKNNITEDGYIIYPFIAQDAIQGLNMTPSGALVNESFQLQFSITHGTYVSFTLHAFGALQSHTILSGNMAGRSTQTFTFDIVQSFLVALEATNLVSSDNVTVDFAIEEEVHGENAVVDEPSRLYTIDRDTFTAISEGDSITVNATVAGGSSVRIYFDWGDGTPNDGHDQGLIQSWPPNQIITRSHMYVDPGVYNMVVSIMNNRNELSPWNQTFIIRVYNQIANLTLHAATPSEFINQEAATRFWFTTESGEVPTAASVVFMWGDSTTSDSEPFGLGVNNSYYDHTYTAVANHTVSVNVSHLFDWAIFTTDVSIVAPVTNMQLSTEPTHAKISQAITLIIRMEAGTAVQLEVDFGDVANTGDDENWARDATTSWQDDRRNHTYNTVGNYSITVIARNAVGNTTIQYIIQVQEPVTSAFTLSSDAPIGYNGSPVSVTLTLSFPSGVTLPTDPYYYINYGDGTQTDPMDLPPNHFSQGSCPCSMPINYTFAEPGDYTATIYIGNLATDPPLRFNVSAAVLAPIGNANVTAKWRVPGGNLLQGQGNNNDQFMLVYPVFFNTSFAGTVTSYTVQCIHSTAAPLNEQFTSNEFEIAFPQAGIWTVTVTLSNDLRSTSTSITVTMNYSPFGLTISDFNMVAGANNPKNFQISFTDVSDDTCLLINWGDNSSSLYTNLGNASQCSNDVASGVTRIAGELQLNNSLNHTYRNEGTYTVFAWAKSPLDEKSQTLETIITSIDCSRPTLSIQDSTNDVTNPMAIYKSVHFYITAVVNIQCAAALTNRKSWRVELVNSTGHSLSTVDISSLTSRNSARLYVPIRFLPYGLYRFTLTVTMEGSSLGQLTFQSAVSTYRKIVPSPLVAQTVPYGMGIITRGSNETVTLKPMVYSKDPDVDPEENQTVEYVEWFCKTLNERYNYTHKTWPKTAEELLALNETARGCFKDGPGKIYESGDDNAHEQRGDLTFSTLNMPANQTYEFNVTVTKDVRRSWTILQLHVTIGQPPNVEIQCSNNAFCVTTANGLLVNPTSRVALKGVCDTSGPTCMGATFQWTMYRQGFSDSWIEVHDFDNYVKGLGSPQIAISTGLFEAGYQLYAHMDVYKIKLRATVGGATGESLTTLLLNKTPYGGNCSIDPRNGTVFQTNWTIHCERWEDDDRVTSYEFVVNYPGEPMQRVLYYGENSEVKPELPEGPFENGHKINIIVRIYDSFNAFTKCDLGDITVLPVPNEDAETEIDAMLDGRNDDINRVSAEGDAEKTNIVFQRITSLLNSKATHDRRQGGNDTAENYQTTRNKRATLREQMTTSLETLPINTVADAVVVATTLSELTIATEEVSRKSQMSSASKMKDMTDLLQALSDRTTVEELQKVSTIVVNVIGQVLESGNVALREPLKRDVDDARGSEYYYYDTDYRSPREELKSISEDERLEILALETNGIVQKDQMAQSVPSLHESVQRIFSMLTDALVAGEDAITMETRKLSSYIRKASAGNLSNEEYIQGNGSVTLPSLCEMIDECDNDTLISVAMTSTPLNSYMQTSNAGNVPYNSGIQSCTIYDKTGREINVENSSVPITITIPLGETEIQLEEYEDIQIPEKSQLFYHCMNVDRENASVHAYLLPQDGHQYMVFGKLGDFPKIKGETLDYDFWGLVPSDHSEASADDENAYIVFADNLQVGGHQGRVCFGISPVLSENTDTYSDVNPPVPQDGNLTANYTLAVWTSGCYFYHRGSNSWKSDGCKVVSSTLRNTVCQCNHLTSFGGGFAVQPNTIDFDYAFANADPSKNPTIYATIGVIGIVYILVAIWARRADKKDIEKMGVTPLPDNDIRDKYLYEVQVWTGSRRGAATDSKVHFILSGDYDETNVRIFEDPKRKIFRRGATDTFIMSHGGPLGPLQFIRLWHDNSGKGKFQGWYCRHIVVHDLQTRVKYFFIIQNWFAVEEGDGQIDRSIPVAGPENMTEFNHLFSKTTRKNLSDDHLWFSVVARPPHSRFTRLQRASCCLSLLATSMIANAMFYQRTSDASGQNALTIGPFALTTQQLYVGFIANLIVFPVNFLLVLIFRRSRPRQKRKSRIEQALAKSGYEASIIQRPSSVAIDKKVLVDMEGKPAQESHPESPEISPTKPLEPAHIRNSGLSLDGNVNDFHTSEDEEDQRETGIKKQKKWSLPWWCTILAWVLLWITVFVCLFFVLFYGITFGDMKTKKWITSLLVSFITSIFFTQPIKVFAAALLFSLIFKKVDLDEEAEEDEEEVKLKQDEEWLHTYQLKPDMNYIPPARQRILDVRPPDPEALAKARDYRIKELKMYDVLREIVFYSFFIWILLVISYSFRDPNAPVERINLDNLLIDDGLGKGKDLSAPENDFRLITTYDHFYDWLNDVLIPNLRADVWYNGDQPIGQRGFVGDRNGRLMGYATLRQLRVKKHLCSVERQVHKYLEDLDCNKPYSTWNEDTEDYGISWQIISANNSNRAPEYIFRKGSEISTYPFWARHAVYSGGGYVTELKGSKLAIRTKIQRLMNESWTDRWTRAVFIEFTVYNANVNLFGVVTLVAEVLNSGGLSTYIRIEPVNLLGNYQNSPLFQMACEIIYLIFIVFFIVKEARNFYRERKQYFKQFWNWVELCIIVTSLSSVAMYFYRLYHTSKLTKIFKETHGNGYMKFQYTAYWNEMLIYFIGILCFLGTIKFIKLLRFNRRIGMLAATLRVGAKPLFWFGIIFLIMFMAYGQFFYLIYYIEVDNFRTFIYTVETLLQMLVGKFNFGAMQAADPVMGPLVFFCYVVTVYYILLNMFLTILNESFTRVREDITLQSNEHEMVEFLLQRFKQWTGLKSLLSEGKKPKEEDQENLEENFPEKFPERVDKLLDVLCRAYLNSGQYDSMVTCSIDDQQKMKEMLKRETDKSKIHSFEDLP